MTALPPPESRRAQDFSLSWLLEVLQAAQVVTKQNAQEITAREAQARARIIKASGEERYHVSPVEIVAAFHVPFGTRQGEVLDQDRISELAASAAGIGYRKIDPLKLDMNLAAKTVSRASAESVISSRLY